VASSDIAKNVLNIIYIKVKNLRLRLPLRMRLCDLYIKFGKDISAKSIDEYDKLVGSLCRYHSGTIGWHSKLVQ
jgi:hypothetical protein